MDLRWDDPVSVHDTPMIKTSIRLQMRQKHGRVPGIRHGLFPISMGNDMAKLRQFCYNVSWMNARVLSRRICSERIGGLFAGVCR